MPACTCVASAAKVVTATGSFVVGRSTVAAADEVEGSNGDGREDDRDDEDDGGPAMATAKADPPPRSLTRRRGPGLAIGRRRDVVAEGRGWTLAAARVGSTNAHAPNTGTHTDTQKGVDLRRGEKEAWEDENEPAGTVVVWAVPISGGSYPCNALSVR